MILIFDPMCNLQVNSCWCLWSIMLWWFNEKKVCKFFACDVTILMRVSWLFTLRSKQTACDVVYDDNDEVCWHDFRNVQLTGMPKFVCFFLPWDFML